MKRILSPIIIFITISALAGCAAPLKIITPAQEPLKPYKILEIAEMKSDVVGKTDAKLLNTIMEEAIEGILDLEHFNKIIVADSINLKPELAEKILRPETFADSSATVAVLKAVLAEYDEGNATLRFFFAPFAGSGKVTLELTLINKKSDKLLIKARTTEKITGSFSSIEATIIPLRKAIVKFIEKNFVKEGEK